MEHNFELIGDLTDIETIAVNLSIRELRRLKLAEVYWYEAHGVGRRKMKIKYILE